MINYNFFVGKVAPSIIISKKANPRRVHVVGESIKLKCRINNADPPPVITWTKDDKSLQMKDNLRLIRDHKYLHFKSLTLEDSGNYTCIVSNKLGEDSYTFILVVKSQIRSKDPSLAPSRLISAPLGGNFSLTCVINSKPKRGMPRVRWVKYTRSAMLVKVFKAPVSAMRLLDQKKKKKRPRTQWTFSSISNGSILVSLTFVNVTYADQGFYACKIGSKRSSNILTSIMVAVKKFVHVSGNIGDSTSRGTFSLIICVRSEFELFLVSALGS